MSSTSISQQPNHRKPLYYGIMFDKYTPQVESQILRDCMALQGMAPERQLVIVCDDQRPNTTIHSIGVRTIPMMKKAKDFILYQTKEFPIEQPEWSRNITVRNFYRPPKASELMLIPDDQSEGYYLPPQGRIVPDQVSLLRPAPNGYANPGAGIANPFVMMWIS